MTEYLPNVYTAFRATYPEVAGALEGDPVEPKVTCL